MTDINAIANTIWSQISTSTKMACATRNPLSLGTGDSAHIRFKVGGRSRYVEISLDPTDTYTVRYFQVKRSNDRVVISETSGVFAENLSETVYRACR